MHDALEEGQFGRVERVLKYDNGKDNVNGKKAQAGKDQEKAQSEKESHSKNQGGKKQINNQAPTPRKHPASRMSSYFPNRWPLSYLNLTKNMQTHTRRQQHKNILNTKT